MRAIGDAYVREEFKRHKNAEPKHLQQFFQQWLQYLEHLRNSTPDSFGRELSGEEVAALSEDQAGQLKNLAKAAADLERDWEQDVKLKPEGEQ